VLKVTFPDLGCENCVRHVIKEEDTMWELDGITDQIDDRMCIEIGPDNSDSSSTDNETDFLEPEEESSD
jgi:hypothetical protein